MFYTKQIGIYTQSLGYKDEYAIWHDGELTITETIDCDLQPITKELAFKIFGIDENVKYRVFCGLFDNIKIGTIIQYIDKKYRVISLLEWDDYKDFIVGDYNG